MNRMILTALAAAAQLMAGPAMAQLRAGAGRVEITPPASAFPFLFERERPLVGVHDPVFARALALDDDGVRALIVVLEVTAVPEPEPMRRAVAAATGVDPANIMIAATHTHSVPSTFMHGDAVDAVRRAEYDRIKAGAVAASRQAVKELRPARVAFQRGEAHVNMNNGEASGAKGWFDPKGFSDKSLDVVRIEGGDGKSIALMLNYASHAEVMFRSVTRDGGYEVTGDLPGATARILEGDARAAPVVLFTAAAEGDQLSLFKSLQPAAELPASDEGAGGWSLQNLLARRLASAALVTLRAMPPASSTAPVSIASGNATCPGQRYVVDRPTGKILRVEEAEPVSIPVQVLRIGDIALAGVGADVASEIGAKIKQGSPIASTSVVTMLAGSVGYVLTDAAFAKPGHGVLASRIKPGCAETELPRTVAALMNRASK